MSSRTATRLLGAFAVPALALGLSACGADEEPASSEGATSADEGAAAALSPGEAVLASVENLSASSYKMESAMTVDGVDFMAMTGMYEGENSQASADIFMGAMMEASGETMTAEEEAMMGGLLGDMHTETVVVDKVMYMQMSGGMFDAMAESFGEDAWFTMDLTSDEEMAQAYAQYGGMDLGQQTELMLSELENVEETGPNTFTGTLSADSEAMSALSGSTGADAAAAIDGTEVTVTLDDNGLLKTMSMTMPEIEGMTMEMTSEIVEIGGTYDIKAPESTNLHDFEELSGGLSGM
ncbi:hypothetical protein [Glycomyces algeriensis]|uniref:Lipoprotein n=1 Tax=Glycomyces algeriensis TaxID=256037 RepID=A0A9W6GCL7_9ACTN|nr:hypothetical protein [Glycomyces algeriensis]MDA1366696.1 hypothetical protein [Glycomyces algeriensis]MDR7351583.1 hypothetical protein [Glycomyces algeriensis]GLI44304.1 hypothetical protein GALLR39Z86_41540 [Glycomyces algeriensis]